MESEIIEKTEESMEEMREEKEEAGGGGDGDPAKGPRRALRLPPGVLGSPPSPLTEAARAHNTKA